MVRAEVQFLTPMWGGRGKSRGTTQGEENKTWCKPKVVSIKGYYLSDLELMMDFAEYNVRFYGGFTFEDVALKWQIFLFSQFYGAASSFMDVFRKYKLDACKAIPCMRLTEALHSSIRTTCEV